MSIGLSDELFLHLKARRFKISAMKGKYKSLRISFDFWIFRKNMYTNLQSSDIQNNVIMECNSESVSNEKL